MLETIINGSVAHSIGWALAHFIWQGAVTGAITSLVLALLGRSAASVRYSVACIGLFVMFVLPIATAIDNTAGVSTAPAAVEHKTTPLVATAGVAPAVSTPPKAVALRSPSGWQDGLLREKLETWLPTAVLLWIIGVMLFSLKILIGWIVVRRMRQEGVAPAPEIYAAVRALASRLRITRPVRVMESALVSVPTVIGSLRPVILWPASAISGLSTEEIEAVIAHELAHIQRYDYFVNILQTLVETLLFYHPAVWIISNRIRIEREHCCDDQAVAVCGDRLVYASALAGLEQLRPDGAALVLRATGGSLLGRVRRLLGAPVPHDRRDPVWIVMAVAAFLLAIAIAGIDETSAAKGHLPPAPPASTARIAPGSLPSTLPSATQPLQGRAAAPSAVATTAQNDAVLTPDSGDGQFRWLRRGEPFEVRYRGVFGISDDDRDITQISPNGYVVISEKPLLGAGRTVELRSQTNGRIERKYFVGGRERSYEPEGKAWISEALPEIVRRTGLAAETRIARILKRGPTAVLSEMSRLESDHVRRLYFQIFLSQANPGGSTFAQAMDQAGREISSDYELAELLISVSRGRQLDKLESDGYFRALDSVGSDYERRRVLSAIAKDVSDPAIVTAMLDSASRIGSDYELAEFLISFAGTGLTGTVRDPFFRTITSVGSDYEQRRVLTAVVDNNPPPETLTMILHSTAGIHSDFERASLLVRIVDRHKLEGAVRDTYLDVAGRIGSEHEKNRVLTSLLKSERQ